MKWLNRLLNKIWPRQNILVIMLTTRLLNKLYFSTCANNSNVFARNIYEYIFYIWLPLSQKKICIDTIVKIVVAMFKLIGDGTVFKHVYHEYCLRKHSCMNVWNSFDNKFRKWVSAMRQHAIMMTSSNGNLFRVTGPLCGEFTGPGEFPHTKASDAELWCFLWSASE